MTNSSKIAADNQHVIMGAGEWFVMAYESGEVDCKAVCVDENYAGETQGGATIDYTITPYVIEDDNGKLRRRFMTKAEASMKTGLLTVDTKAIGNLMSVGKLETPEGGTKRTLKLSGGNAQLKRFVVVFRYPKDKDKGLYIYIGMVATNTAPLSLAFTKDKETIMDLQYDADTNGVDDTILVIEEDLDQTEAAAVSENQTEPTE